LLPQSKPRAKAAIQASGAPRKAQLATQKYKASGGGYKGPKKADNSLSKWIKEDWGTRSGKPSTQGPKATGERYLPKAAREKLTLPEYAATTRAKREGMRQGKQFVPQPELIKKKVW